MNIEILQAAQKILWEDHDKASAAVQVFIVATNGLTPDSVKFSQPFRTAKAEYNQAFQALRAFNKQHIKTLNKVRKPRGYKSVGVV